MKLYIAGPMRGKPLFNFPAFGAAAAALRASGHDVISPHEMDLALGQNATSTELPFIEYMQRDLPALMSCDAIALLPGWTGSRGARLEACVAHACGLKSFYFDGTLKEEKVRVIPVPETFAATRQAEAAQ